MAPAVFPVTIPGEAARVLTRLWEGGHAAYLVGGGVRDALLGRTPPDWDVATDARPERMLAVFPGARYENRFGTVSVDGVQVTTFRRDHRYGDHRRPDAVTFTDSLDEDLARRDFTVNAIAWGRPAGEGRTAPIDVGEWVDPLGGRTDLAGRLLRAVGDPDERFDEDALRLVRAARLAAQLRFSIEPATRGAMARQAPLVRFVSAERVGAELLKMLRADPPSTGFRILADTGLLAPLFPLLDAQRGIPQEKIAGHDLWEHSLATLDAAARLTDDDALALTALLHDIGKPATFADGHFIGHDEVGAGLARDILAALAIPGRDIERVTRLIRHHMFRYEPIWTDAAVRRFMRRVGPELVDDLLVLRQADNVGSGREAEDRDLAELRARVREQRDAHVPLSLRDLAVDGHDLQRELGMRAGPELGRVLERLLDSVIGDPARNTRERLLADAHRFAAAPGQALDGRSAAADDDGLVDADG